MVSGGFREATGWCLELPEAFSSVAALDAIVRLCRAGFNPP